MDALLFYILCATPITAAFVIIGAYKIREARREAANNVSVVDTVLTESPN